MQQAHDVGLDHLAPVVFANVGNGALAERQPAIVEQAVDGREIRGQGVDGAGNAVAVGQIHFPDMDLARREFAGKRSQPVEAAAEAGDLPALLREMPCGGGAETGGGASDENGSGHQCLPFAPFPGATPHAAWQGAAPGKRRTDPA